MKLNSAGLNFERQTKYKPNAAVAGDTTSPDHALPQEITFLATGQKREKADEKDIK